MSQGESSASAARRIPAPNPPLNARKALQMSGLKRVMGDPRESASEAWSIDWVVRRVRSVWVPRKQCGPEAGRTDVQHATEPEATSERGGKQIGIAQRAMDQEWTRYRQTGAAKLLQEPICYAIRPALSTCRT